MSNNQLDYWTMLFQLSARTKYSDEYLLSLSEEEIEKLYKEKVE
ncbi:hypothetical protein J6TS2_50750 [Heyndrickxia sporothermodurans]|nr:hypothetical protein J6TS2_50750 [Heyndrickxia sporothermodurans]